MKPEIPSIWREEVWHAFSVHLPIVTLLFASLAIIVICIVKKQAYALFLNQLFYLMLGIGVLSGWIAIYTGELSYAIEVRKICDPKVLQEHQWWSYATLIAYSVVLALHLVIKIFAPVYLNKIRLITLLVTLAALLGLLYTGHLGASLVYQQGAGTYQPSEKCIEFVK